MSRKNIVDFIPGYENHPNRRSKETLNGYVARKDVGYSKSKNSGSNYSESCYKSHPVLKIGSYKIRGGSCYSPVESDIHIGFDSGMKSTPKRFPWNGSTEIKFPIVDGGVPDSRQEFDNLLNYTVEKLKEGKTVHCGYIGGHGRTGLFLAALVKRITGNEDAISYVRENYCKKAVESDKQVDWLHDNYGIKKIEASKKYIHVGKDKDYYSGSKNYYSYADDKTFDLYDRALPFRTFVFGENTKYLRRK